MQPRPLAGVALGVTLAFALLGAVIAAEDEERVLRAPDAWLTGIFADAVPEPALVWLTGDLKQRVADVLGHPYPGLRLRYWQRDGTSAWILEEIGKTQPITAGFAVGPQGLRDVEVLVYRESRGDEVRHDYFTRQFSGAHLNGSDELDRRIDGITGATLSVDAMTRLSRVALVLDAAVRSAKGSASRTATGN